MSTPAEQPKPKDIVGQGGLADHLTDGMALAVVEFMCDLASVLNMAGWKILVLTEPCEDDCWADINHIDGKLTAQLRVCRTWMTLPRETQCEALTHETLHLLHYRIDDVISDMPKFMGIGDAMRTGDAFRRELEYMVDHLARYIASKTTVQEAWVKFLRKHKVK